ncbi:MAG: tetratricopeptide repeat protein [Rhodospirillales bacterium]
MRRIYFLILLTGLLVTGVPVWADQNSPMLDDLFRQLKTETNPEDATVIEQKIWKIWSYTDNIRAHTPFARGVVSMRAGAYDDAYRYFRDVTAIAPGFAEGWNKLATVNYSLGAYDASVRDIRRTLALEPRHFGALSGLALIYEATDLLPQALDVLNQVKEIYPSMPGIDQRMQTLQDAIAAQKI